MKPRIDDMAKGGMLDIGEFKVEIDGLEKMREEVFGFFRLEDKERRGSMTWRMRDAGFNEV